MSLHRIQTGVEAMEGLPGSGKSFMALQRVLDAMTLQRRPVFTNLPLRWRVVRQWLRNRGGEQLSGLIYELTEAHFRAFLDRAAGRDEFRKVWLADRARSKLPPSDEAFRRAWTEKAGPDVLRRVERPDGTWIEPNWVLPTAMIVIDECHHWFPADAKVARSETPSLVKYLTMLRHHVHLLVWVTQERMQVSITIRRLTALWWSVRQRGQDRIAWGLRLAHFRVSAFGYVVRTREQEEQRGGRDEDGRPAVVRQETVFPWLPSNRWKFRLYQSHTHVGSVRALRRDLERARQDVGLSAGGMLEKEIEEREARREARKGYNVFKFLGRWMVRLSILGVVLLLGVAVGWAGGRDKTVPPLQATVVESGGGDVQMTEPEKWPELQSMGVDFIRTSEGRTKLGESINGAELLAVRVGRACVLGRDGNIWLWHLSEAQPKCVGSTDEVTTRVRERLVATGRAWGAAVPTSAGFTPGGMGPSESDIERGGSPIR